ncbi:heme/hemin ABC transporter substrate-binding protein [Streptomyces tagetis]|uniref:ABC transporter substrate-binding protein n=1 Tax=Streptomyces tagetis TaxID=2820809 RepID=A0A941B5F4_9ACTN|nr:ABC transporter substrate-binding protein [Streptomyces sp. RG38]MBQ0825268.1 ABC transporter substrate-binding protein [Streptomyces sp. RG38]
MTGHRPPPHRVPPGAVAHGRAPGRTRPTRRRTLGGLLLVVPLLLSGCQAPAGAAHAGQESTSRAVPWSQVTPLADPRSYRGPTTATVPDADITPVTRTPRPELPATVTDAQGTKVTVRSDDRILALDLYGTLAATVYGLGLGDRLVGRDQSTGIPAAAKLPLVTSGAHQLNAEAILALHPSVLITDTTLGPWDAVLQIRDSGVPVVVVDSRRSLETVGTLVDEVAAALGVRAEGELLRKRLDKELAAEQAQIDRIVPSDAARRPRVLFLYARGQAGVYYIFGKGSGTDSLIASLRAVDVAGEAGLSGFTPLNAEAMAKARPDVILMMSEGLRSVGGVDGALQLPGVAQTPAGKHRRIVDMSDYQVLSFGPLTPRVLDALARSLYAPESVAAAPSPGAAP